MKTSEVLAMSGVIERLAADPAPKPAKFAYAIARNMRKIEGTVAAFREAMKGDWGALESFERARSELVQQHAQRDDEGNMIPIGVNQAALIDPDAYAEDLKQLEQSHPDAKGALVLFQERQTELLDVEVDIVLQKVGLDDLPDLSIAAAQALLPMIIDDEEG